MTEKICTKCRLQKPLADFVKDSTITSGYAATCLQCNKISCRARYQRNKVMANESSAAYYEANKSSIKAYQKEYREKHRERLAEQKREYYLANKVRLGEAMAEYARVNADQIAQYQKEYRDSHKGQIADRTRIRNAGRSTFVKQKAAKRRQDLHRELRRLVLLELGGACYCCGLDDLRFLTIDHVHNDGNYHRKLNTGKSKNGYTILLDIQKQGFPKDRYRAACYNCNCARNLTRDKVCPHQAIHA